METATIAASFALRLRMSNGWMPTRAGSPEGEDVPCCEAMGESSLVEGMLSVSPRVEFVCAKM
jgi:hypothetical protein